MAIQILSVDDSRTIRLIVGKAFKPYECTMLEAGNGEEGLVVAAREKPDLIILDVMMDRHTDGFDLCYNLKHDEACRTIPIMMVTAVTEKTGFKFSPETDGEYLEADAYVAKPIPVAELLFRVNKMIGGAGS